ncbi:MAG: hypothetical protein ACTTID_02275 [Bacillales bacterium]
MKKTGSEEIKIKVNTRRFEINNNKLVRIFYIIMSVVFFAQLIFFAISARNIDTFYGGVMTCVFIIGYMIIAFLTIKRNQENTFISLLYLVLIYSIPCGWIGISYSFAHNYDLLRSVYDYIQFGVCLSAIIIAILGINYYYRNNMKLSSLLAIISIIISIICLILGGTNEILKASSKQYYPLVGIGFLVEAVIGFLPLSYLFKTV